MSQIQDGHYFNYMISRSTQPCLLLPRQPSSHRHVRQPEFAILKKPQPRSGERNQTSSLAVAADPKEANEFPDESAEAPRQGSAVQFFRESDGRDFSRNDMKHLKTSRASTLAKVLSTLSFHLGNLPGVYLERISDRLFDFSHGIHQVYGDAFFRH